MGRLSKVLLRLPLLAALAVASCATLPAAHASGSALEASAWRALSPGVEYASFAWGIPRREVHALRIDLARVDVEVTPPGKEFGQVTGRSLLDFAREFGCEAAVNATPFYPETWRRGDTLYLSGVLILDGKMYAAPAHRYVALAFDHDGKANIVPQAGLGDEKGWNTAIGGFFELLRGGVIVARKSPRQPMTVVGTSEGGGILLLAVIEGRRPASAGASEAEAAQLLIDLGATEGMSFDGGGSSEMVIVGDNGKPHLVNWPAPGFPPIERVLATCLGFRSKAR